VTEDYDAPQWDRRGVVQAFVSEFREQGPGPAGPRVVAGLAVLVVVIVAMVLFGFLTRPPAKQPSPDISGTPAGISTIGQVRTQGH
jgi:hypothetical protein